MAYLTREEALTELCKGDAVLFGDPDRDVPLSILDQAKQGVGSLPLVPDELQSEPLLEIPFVTVVGPAHRLAATRGTVSAAAIARHVQLVLTDRTVLTEGRDFGVLSPLTWRLADLGAKHAFLKAGLGWGHMPLHMVKADLDSAALVKIRVEGIPRTAAMPMSAVFRKDAPPGPAGRAFIAQLKRC